MSDKLKVLLTVADEIEADPKYTGKRWIQDEKKDAKGCAFYRVVIISGAIPHERNPYLFKLEGFNDDEYFSYGQYSTVLEHITGIKSNFFDDIAIEYSTKCTKVKIVKLLRMLANNQYDFEKSIQKNVYEPKVKAITV